MRLARSLFATTLLVVGIILLSSAARIYSQQQAAAVAPFEFMPSDALSIEKGEEISLQIQNNTSNPLQLTLQVVDIEPAGSKPISDYVKITPDNLRISPASGGKVIMQVAAGSPIDPKHASGYVVAFESGSKNFAHRRFQIAETENQQSDTNAKAPPNYFVDKWQATVKYLPWASRSEETRNDGKPLEKPIPLAAGRTPENTLTDDKPLARLVNEHGDTALLKYGGSMENLPSDLFGMKLEFYSQGRPGKYVGNLSKPKGGESGSTKAAKGTSDKDEEGKVAVTIIVTDYIFFPILAILTGILLAFYFKQRYISVSRPLLILEERAAQLEQDFNIAEERFKKDSAGQTFASYSIKDDMDKQLRLLVSQIKALKHATFLALGANDTTAIDAKLTDLSAQVVSWNTFAERLAKLHEALSEISSWPKPPFIDPPPDNPAVFIEATRMLKGAELSVEQFKLLSKGVDDTIPLLLAWNRFNEKAAQYWKTIHEPDDPFKLKLVPDDQLSRLTTTHEKLFTAWRRLWMNTDYDLKQTKADLDTIDADISFLKQYLKISEEEFEEAIAVFAGEDKTEGPGEIEVWRVGLTLSPKTRTLVYRLTRFLLDSILILLSVGASLYTGLAELYFNQPFGTGLDYIKAIAWGFTAQLVLSTVITGLNLLWNAKSALPFSRT